MTSDLDIYRAAQILVKRRRANRTRSKIRDLTTRPLRLPRISETVDPRISGQ
jgi:hypothetical protein